jgi:hypothetical protein
LVGTKALIRKGRVTGLPVSGWIDELTTAVSAVRATYPRLTLLGVVVRLLGGAVDPEALLARGLDPLIVVLDVLDGLVELRRRREEGERRRRAVKVREAAAWGQPEGEGGSGEAAKGGGSDAVGVSIGTEAAPPPRFTPRLGVA